MGNDLQMKREKIIIIIFFFKFMNSMSLTPCMYTAEQYRTTIPHILHLVPEASG